ncbi:unnamed protein product [Rotaria sp. Silwood2]|nr:unnamed protein product [Rotaria sp. Silwood2]CAF3392613.1 unnamed protein product [Rotaria sp. Silwood2]
MFNSRTRLITLNTSNSPLGKLNFSSSGIQLEFQYEDDIRGLVSARSSDGVNEAARDQASPQQLLRVFVKFIKENFNRTKPMPSKYLGVICCNRSPIIGIRYKCLECVDYDLCESCADCQLIHSHHVLAKIRTPDQTDVVRKLCSTIRSNPNHYQQQPQRIKVPSEFMVNQGNQTGKDKSYQSNGTQAISSEEKDPIIDDEMEIIPSNELHDDFVQLDYHPEEQE